MSYSTTAANIIANLTTNTLNPTRNSYGGLAVSDALSTKRPYITPSSETCLIQRHDKKLFDYNLYEGIPETLLLNVIGWCVFVLLFAVLRQQAWDYGRLALVNSNGDNKRWTQLFYAHTSDEQPQISNGNRAAGEAINGPGSTATMDSTTSGSGSVGPSNSRTNLNNMETGSIHHVINRTSSSHSYTHSIDRGFFSWIRVTLFLKKDQILEHSGPDAVHYLSFQQHLMFVMAIITVVSTVIILPINFQGTLSGDLWSFGHTTISNLEPTSPLLWIHVLVAIAYVPLVVLVMRRTSGRNAFKTAASRTIMITDIAPADCDRITIRNYLTQLFPEIQIEAIELAYNIAKLTELWKEYERIADARIYCEMHKNHRPVVATPNIFTCKTVDGLEYYKNVEAQIQGDVARLRASALNDPVGIAFVTVPSTDKAKSIITRFKPSTYRNWCMSYAPAPSDIFWENLNVTVGHWYIKWAVVNIILFIFLFFLTTPVLIVNLMDTFSMAKATTMAINKISPLISEFLPTLLLWTLTALLPVIVTYSDKWLSHWTRSKQNYSIMTKSFGYLLFMVLILPSMGLTSAQAFLEWTLKYNGNESYRWECIFLPDKGAFFVNYVITAAFIGTSLELLRFPELIVYIWQLLTSKSRAETPYIRRSILIEFPFGIHYAWTVMVFTLSTVYSVICPLIMPFAMIYITLKHFGDKHNLYFAYGPSNMISQSGGRIHSTAVTMTKFSVILLL